MFPEEFKKRIKTQDYIDSEALVQALQEPSPVSIRINPLKWKRKPLASLPVPWSENGYYLEKRPSYTLDPLFHSGCYYPQEASGMFLEHVIRSLQSTLQNIRVLDLCGAPGGKSTLISDLLQQESCLIANEVIRSRSAVLAETVTKWGKGNTIVTNSDPSAFGRMPGYFDIVFVDAPCSGEGMFRTNVAVDEWSVANTMLCAERQKRILMDIWPALKEDGTLIYSTCTFNPGENEENIKWLVARHEAECLQIDISPFNGITEIDYQGIRGYGFYPGKVPGEGFFISAIRKKGKQPSDFLKAVKKNELVPSKEDLSVAEKWTFFPKGRLIKWNNGLSAVPCSLEEYTQLFRNLKIVKAGTRIFNLKNKDFLPDHEVALSTWLRKDSFPKVEVELKEAIAYLQRGNLSVRSAAPGWNIVTYKDVNLGFIKNIGSRINNYFPVEWRIRMNSPEPGNENIINWEQ